MTGQRSVLEQLAAAFRSQYEALRNLRAGDGPAPVVVARSTDARTEIRRALALVGEAACVWAEWSLSTPPEEREPRRWLEGMPMITDALSAEDAEGPLAATFRGGSRLPAPHDRSGRRGGWPRTPDRD
jgi:hypothetical protein